MRLYAIEPGVTTIEDPDFGTFTSDEEGRIEGLPDELYARLHAIHVGGKAQWESEEERDARLTREEDERRKDPATLLAAVERLQGGRELTAAELREAHEERLRIRAEEDAAEEARIAKLEAAEQEKAAADARADEERQANEAKAEEDRIAGLDVKVGDAVRIREDQLAVIGQQAEDSAQLESLATWRGRVVAVYRDATSDRDVADVEGIVAEGEEADPVSTIPVENLQVVDLEAEAAAAAIAQAEAEAIAAETKPAPDEAPKEAETPAEEPAAKDSKQSKASK